MAILGNGNVGIGTNSPDTFLHIDSASTNNVPLKVESGAATSFMQFKDTGTTADFKVRVGSNADNLLLWAGGSERMRITSSGLVGIGTSSPGVKLDIVSSSSGSQIELTSPTPGIKLIDSNLTTRYAEIKAENGNVNIDIDPGQAEGTSYFSVDIDNSEKFRITKDGNVGIGTTSPNANLHVYSSGNGEIEVERASGALINFQAQASLGTIGTDSNHPLYLKTNAGTRMAITTSGNIGIGTTSPSQKLTVSGNTLSVGNITAYGDSSNSSILSSTGYIQLRNSGSTNVNIKSNGNSYLNGGNVGIGTTSPNQKLTIKGTDQYVAAEQTNYVWGGTTTIGLRMGTDATAGLLDFRRWIGSATTHGTALITQVNSDGGYGLDFRVDTKSSNTVATTSRMFLSQSGEVGIGTTSPSQKLHVNGATQVDNGGLLLGGTSSVNGNNPQLRRSNSLNDLIIATGGSDRVAILGNGNVGIGTTSPAYLLDVNEDDNVLAFRVTGGGGGAPIASFVRDVGATGSQVNINAQSNFPQIQFTNTGNTFSIGGDTSGNFKISDNTSIGTNDRITIDNTGNVGIGTTDPGKKLHVSSSDQSTARIRLSNTNTASGGDDIELVAGVHNVTQDGFSIYNATSNQTQLVIQGAGNVGIGTTDPNYMLHLGGSTIGAVNGQLAFGDVTNVPSGLIQGYRVDGSYKGELRFSTSTSGGTVTQRMVIDEDGNVGIGTTSPSARLHVSSGTALVSGYIYSGSTSVGFTNFFSYFAAQATNGMLVRDGSTYKPVLASAFTVSSDYRLKSNIEPLENATSRLKQLEVHRFNWTDRLDEPKVDGFIAHEVSSIVPEAVLGEKDEVYEDGTPKHQGIDQAKLVPLLTAALQEAITKIENLESRIQTLENQ